MTNIERVTRLLTHAESLGMTAVLADMDGRTEATITAAVIADTVGIARSAITNGLRIFEAAGFIETYSCGSKGTFVKVLEPALHGLVRAAA